MTFSLRHILLFAAAAADVAFGQSIVLDDFNADTASGHAIASTTWVGHVVQGPTTISTGTGTKDENGWGATGLDLNATGLKFVLITAQRDTGNAAPSLMLQLEDRNLAMHTVAISTSAFAVGTPTTVQVAIGSWPAGFDPTHIAGWSIGGGAPGLDDFRMTFDHLALTGTASADLPVAPVVAGDFAPRTVAAGASVTFTVTATGSGTLTYQWRKDSTPLAGATTTSLSIASAVPTDSGSYVCAVTNSAGTTLSAPFVLNVTAPAAAITLGNLSTTYDGRTKTPTALTSPAGLPVTFTYNGSTVAPVNAGTYAVVATINDPLHKGTASGTLTIARAAQSITFAALPASVTVGTPFTVGATASSGGAVTLAVASGNATLNGSLLTVRDPALVRLRATQAGDENFLPATSDFTFTAAKRNQSITFAAITDQPADVTSLTLHATANSGLSVVFNVIEGPGALKGDTVEFTGTGIIIVRASQPGSDEFNAAPPVDRAFHVAVPTGTPQSPPPEKPSEPVALAAPRLVNLSTRTRAASGDQVAIAGFVIGGTEPKPVLVRAVGPSLQTFGVEGVLSAPKLELFHGSTLVASNTGWTTGGSTAALAAAAERAGAFALGAGTADSALLATLPPGDYTAVISAADGRSGVGLAEVYDLSAPAAPVRLTNLSVRAFSGTDAETLIVGLVVEGPAPQRMLIRGVGPGLAPLGVSDALARPVLTVFSGSSQIARNSGWSTASNSAEIASAGRQVGAFPLAGGSADAALILSLSPGAYTVQIAGADASSGTALVEVYEIP